MSIQIIGIVRRHHTLLLALLVYRTHLHLNVAGTKDDPYQRWVQRVFL